VADDKALVLRLYLRGWSILIMGDAGQTTADWLLEQPVAYHDLEGMALVRRSVETPICADEACYSPTDAVRIVRAGAADVLNVKIGKAGGLLNAAKVLAIGEAAGLRCVLGTAFGTGLEIAAKLHLAAAHPEVTDAVEFTELTLHGSLVAAAGHDPFSLPLADGALPVPTGPGLGVDVDAATVRSLASQVFVEA
jgi:muconate cycloisomerase